MADIRRLANLPGYDDTARDIYETPDLTDDTTSTTTFTQRTTSPRSPASGTSNSSNEEDYEDDDDGAEESDDQSYGVSRRRLYPERARRKFNGVRSGGRVDLSDRVDGRRKGLRVRSTREKEEKEDEGLEARIARLRREIEECKAEAAAQGDGGSTLGDLEGLSGVLKGVEVSGRRDRGEEVFADAEGGVEEAGANAGEGVTDEQILGRVGHFDSRLSALEQALGISALHSATVDAASTPVLPSLLLLDQQLATLSSAGSLMNLETASARIQKLKTEADQLTQSQLSQATTAKEDDDETQSPTTLTPEDMTKLRSLYQLLPTLQSLSPTVPALLTRLRSLRTLHTTAATAAEALEEVEKRQAEMEGELKAWREGLEKVEAAVAGANEANGRNGVVVEGWVKEIEGRVEGLSV
ncbi:Dynamitin-domain-containing protein [Neohortaea acidophila]|uniref:Dynamitin-domain-containing protein n=1 Tax=Neohortaea acidophila TaxID=245834 RepID=A0A6A6PQH8_9PEZI|nr:Dynamitin-domain-containing protein [Neohortaea acidophila]KAF2482262.1 Dynamitin-domain-containing protein [Neohortaea acidophila]